MIFQLLFFTIIAAEPKEAFLEFSGTKGIKFSGICVSKETGQTKEIEGVSPAKITLDLNIEKCSIQKKGKKGTLKVRLFHNKQLITDKSLSQPTSGIDLVIPFF